MAKKRRTYRRRRSTGLAGLPARANTIKNDAIDVVLTGVGAFGAAKLISLLDSKINTGGSKMMSFVAPAIAAVGGLAGSAFIKQPFVKAACKGVALGGVLKVAEKAFNKENLLSGVDEPLMLPGIGDIGLANLPELSHYSENEYADVTTTGNDPQYHMGQPSEVLSGDEDMIAY